MPLLCDNFISGADTMYDIDVSMSVLGKNKAVVATAPITAIYDDEFLVRAFVRMRRESCPENSMVDIEEKVRERTSYRLPIYTAPRPREYNVLKRVFSDLEIAHRRASLHDVTLRKVLEIRLSEEPTEEVLVYSDVFTGLPLAYEEYEKRYYNYIGRRPHASSSSASSSSSSSAQAQAEAPSAVAASLACAPSISDVPVTTSATAITVTSNNTEVKECAVPADDEPATKKRRNC